MVIASVLESEKNALGALITMEMGKTLSSAVAEAAKCATACRFYAENAEHMLADEEVATGASAWTQDPAERERFADEIEAGIEFINQMVASDTRIPFGGGKASSHGRELGVHGIREFTTAKTVWIK